MTDDVAEIIKSFMEGRVSMTASEMRAAWAELYAELGLEHPDGVEMSTEDQINRTAAKISAATDHFEAAEAASACHVVKSDGSFYFGDLMVAHSMMALVEELRKR